MFARSRPPEPPEPPGGAWGDGNIPMAPQSYGRRWAFWGDMATIYWATHREIMLSYATSSRKFNSSQACRDLESGWIWIISSHLCLRSRHGSNGKTFFPKQCSKSLMHSKSPTRSLKNDTLNIQSRSNKNISQKKSPESSGKGAKHPQKTSPNQANGSTFGHPTEWKQSTAGGAVSPRLGRVDVRTPNVCREAAAWYIHVYIYNYIYICRYMIYVFFFISFMWFFLFQSFR